MRARCLLRAVLAMVVLGLAGGASMGAARRPKKPDQSQQHQSVPSDTAAPAWLRRCAGVLERARARLALRNSLFRAAGVKLGLETRSDGLTEKAQTQIWELHLEARAGGPARDLRGSTTESLVCVIMTDDPTKKPTNADELDPSMAGWRPAHHGASDVFLEAQIREVEGRDAFVDIESLPHRRSIQGILDVLKQAANACLDDRLP